MQYLLEIGRTGVSSVVRHPLRSTAILTALLAVLVPFLTGLGLSLGIRDQADDSIRFGADLYVSVVQFGRTVPLSLDAVSNVERVDGVVRVVPRVVGSLTLGAQREPAVIVGMPPEAFPVTAECVEGRLYQSTASNEFVVGSVLAHRLGLHVGSVLPPFYQNSHGERLSRVVGIFRTDAPIWQAHLIFTSCETAAALFDQSGYTTGLLVNCRAGYSDHVRREILRDRQMLGAGSLPPRVVSRDDLKAWGSMNFLRRDGLFSLHSVLGFSIAILMIVITSDMGVSSRRREIGILKATGWQTDEILMRSAVENLLLAFAGAATSIVLAYTWMRLLNGFWIASVFLPDLDLAPGIRVPFRLAPVPVILALVISLVVILSGTLYSSWRAAMISPKEAMRL